MPDKYSATRHRWAKENLDRYDLSMPKGKKQEIKDHAAAMGESMNGFIIRAINEAIERDTKK